VTKEKLTYKYIDMCIWSKQKRIRNKAWNRLVEMYTDKDGDTNYAVLAILVNKQDIFKRIK